MNSKIIKLTAVLDSDSLELVARAAKDADAQVWIERVGTEGKMSVIIEDGLIRETETE